MNFIFKTLFFSFFIFVNDINSQTKHKGIENLSYDKLKYNYFNIAKSETDKKELANTFIRKGIRENKPIKIARGYYYLSLLYYDNYPQKAIMILDSVIKYSKNTDDENFPQSAYREKAYLLRNQYKYEEAIQNYILAEKISKTKNLDFYYKVKLDIAELKSEELGDVEEALVIYRECYNYYKTKDTRSLDYSYAYNQTLFDLADAHKSLLNTDSTTYYNHLGFENSKIINDEESKYLFVLNEGANLVLKKKYKIALDSIKKALPVMIKYKNQINVLASFYYLGKTHDLLGNQKEALKNYISVDSLYQKEKRIFPEFTDGYNFLIQYYRAKRNKELQLKYLNTLMAIDSANQKKYRKLDKVIRKKYEIPLLLEGKENAIKQLRFRNKSILFLALILTVLALSLGIYVIYQRKINKKAKERFESVINNSNAFQNHDNRISKTNTSVRIESEEKSIGIAKELIEQILYKLNEFEKEKGYLNSNVSIQFLAKEFETNSRYLSNIINEYKKKSFSQYINDLRIDYAIKILQEDSRLRKYSISALANEFGFNTAESFSNGFYKRTGIKPSYFIKELGKG